MLRPRFASGLTLGLALGVPSGAVIALLILPPRVADRSGATALQIDVLTRKLEAANDERQRMEQQLQQFQKLAEQMTNSFNTLELRFTALEEEQRVREARAGDTRASPPPTPTAAPPPTAVEHPPDANPQ